MALIDPDTLNRERQSSTALNSYIVICKDPEGRVKYGLFAIFPFLLVFGKTKAFFAFKDTKIYKNTVASRRISIYDIDHFVLFFLLRSK